MLEIDIFRNSSKKDLGVPKGVGSGVQTTPRRPAG